MYYPDKLVTLEDGLSIFIPDPEQIKSTYENQLARNEKTSFPFWAKIWPSAIALVSFLKEEPGWIKDKTVLELGAGIGYPSLAMAHHTKNMIISDHATEAVSLLKKNIAFLKLEHVKAMPIDWNDFPDEIHAEIVLLSDINYAPGQFEPLLQLIKKLVEKNSVVILSTPQRITIAPFAEALQPFIKRSVLKTVGYMNQAIEVRLLILSN